MSQALALEALAPVQREQVQVIGRAGKELAAVIDDLLDLSAIEAGRLELNCGVANLAEIAGAVEALFRPAAREKDLQLSLQVSGAGGDWHCDERRVRQVLTTLVANAVKFTEQGEVCIILAQGPEGVVLSVADTGPGIASGLRERLFEPFVQGDSSPTRLHRGVGLGLAICRELVRLMGGEISVTSVVGEGSTFAVRLTFNAVPKADQFAPGRTVESVKKAMARAHGLDPRDAAEHVLQLAGSTERPDADTHIGALVGHGTCALAFDLVPLKRVEG